MTNPVRLKFKCPAPNCTQEAFRIRPILEGYIHPPGDEKPILYLVQCPKHGLRVIGSDGERACKTDKRFQPPC